MLVLKTRKRVKNLVALMLVGLLGVTACGEASTADAAWRNPGESDGASQETPVLQITSPAPDSTEVPTSAELVLTVEGAESTTVELVDENGQTVDGAFRTDGSSWVPGRQLDYDTTYTARVTAVNEAGETVQEVTFTTMPEPDPDSLVSTGFYLFDDSTYGVAMPFVIEFSEPIADKEAVERRLFIDTNPPVTGAWHWFGDRQVHFRPQEYWQPGTTITVRAGIGGLPLGNGLYGERDRSATNITIGDDVRFVTDDRTKQMTVTVNGEVVRTIPVSLGAPDMPSYEGHMVIMEKLREAIFTSESNGVDPDDTANGGYRTEVEYAMRMTWSGQFIHAAPWSVEHQGVRNVSHGCVNVSTENAAFLFELGKIGDPAIVQNTGEPLPPGDGWTGWDMSWDEYLEGSMLGPVTTDSLATV